MRASKSERKEKEDGDVVVVNEAGPMTALGWAGLGLLPETSLMIRYLSPRASHHKEESTSIFSASLFIFILF